MNHKCFLKADLYWSLSLVDSLFLVTMLAEGATWADGLGLEKGFDKPFHSVKQSDRNSSKTDIFHTPTTYKQHV